METRSSHEIARRPVTLSWPARFRLRLPANAYLDEPGSVLPRLPAVGLSMSVPDFPAGIDSQKGADQQCSHRERFIKGVAGFR